MGVDAKVIKAQSVHKESENTPFELLATLCYFYPQYTFREARALPYQHVKLLLKVARREEAIKYYNLTQISAAPHTKKGEGVKKLVRYFKKQIDG